MSQSAGLRDTAPHAVEVTIGRIDESVARLAASASTLSDEQLRAPSLLPGWTRGHVLAHVSGNADSLRNLLIWAHTGVQTPQYASYAERVAQIEARSGQAGDELVAELTRSAKEFTDQAHQLAGHAWAAEVSGLNGLAHPAWFTLYRRLTEVEVHHVDLAAGYGPADWPGWFVEEMLYRVTGQVRADPKAPAAELTDTSSGRQFFLRPDAAADVAITGQGHDLLAWLLGRSGGADLAGDPPGPLPAVPAF